MPALQGLGVLVTRPQHQAAALCRLLELEGARTARFPALDIAAVGNLAVQKRRLGPLENFDLVVVTSANAVRFGSGLLEGAPQLAAIGPATARALIEVGHPATISAADGFDSESLLAHPALAALAGKRVLLVKGMHGRDLLQVELAARGARVDVAEVYRRERVQPTEQALAEVRALLAAREMHVVTATSVEIAECLLAMEPEWLRIGLHELLWLVPGARVAAALRGRGLGAPILPAASANDQDLVAAVVRWRSSVSGA